MNGKEKQTGAVKGESRRFIDPQQIDWNLLKAFQLVADSGSLTRAAVALGTSQPTLSRQIAELEVITGTALFERVARGVRVTAAGEALLDPTRRMLAAAQAVSLAATARNQETGGTVRITASEIMAAFVLPAVFCTLRTKHPDIQIELVASNRVDNLLEREADIAIRMVRPQQAGLIARKIADYPLGFYAHKDYLARKKLSTRNATPEQFDWIGLDQSNQMLEGFRAAGFSVDRTFFAFRCDNQIVGWQAVLAGMGVGVTLQTVARACPQVVRVMAAQTLPDLPVWLTAHRELRDTPRIRTVFDFLAQALA